MSGATINLILQLISGLLSTGPAMYEQATALQAKLQQFQAENRDPTAEEFRELFSEIDVDEATIDAAYARLGE